MMWLWVASYADVIPAHADNQNKFHHAAPMEKPCVKIEAAIIAKLEKFLSAPLDVTYHIENITDKARGLFCWVKHGDRSRLAMIFDNPTGGYRVLIARSGKTVLSRITNAHQRDKFDDKNLSNDPMAHIFEPEVKFVPHSDSFIGQKVEGIGQNLYRLTLYNINKPEQKTEFCFEMQNDEIAFKQWHIYAKDPSSRQMKKTTLLFHQIAHLRPQGKDILLGWADRPAFRTIIKFVY